MTISSQPPAQPTAPVLPHPRSGGRSGRFADGDELRTALVEAGHLVATGVDGLYQRSGLLDDLVVNLTRRLASRKLLPGSTRLAFPPLIPRAEWLRTGYARSFPDLLGSVRVFDGGEAEHRQIMDHLDADEPWDDLLVPAEVVLSSAACHGLYGTLPTDIPAEGTAHELTGFCFRHEPSTDPARQQSFRMYEFVRVGTPAQAAEHREAWLEIGPALLRDLGLPVRVEVAHDPFFGRTGRLLSNAQTEAAAKHEFVVDLTEERGTAIMSVNLADDHFGHAFGLTTPDGGVAHTACAAAGLDRVALAVLVVHGFDPASWPDVLQP